MVELGISNLDSEVLHVTRSSSVLLLIEVAGLYINNATKSTAFHALSFYRFGDQLLKKLYDLFEKFNALRKLSFLGS